MPTSDLVCIWFDKARDLGTILRAKQVAYELDYIRMVSRLSTGCVDHFVIVRVLRVSRAASRNNKPLGNLSL